MTGNEFTNYMKKQTEEIIKYKDERNFFIPEYFKNQYVFEWIDRYSEDFQKKWDEIKNLKKF